jgi:selenocysteine lyase/cysteine desulfurase
VAHAPTEITKWGVDGVSFTPYKVFGKRGLGLGWVSERVASLHHEKILEKSKDNWGLGSVETAAFGAWSATVDYICWLGRHFADKDDRRSLVLSGMESIERHERALLERALNGTEEIPGLRKMDGVKVHFLPEDEVLNTWDCLFPITIDGKRTDDVVQEYMKNGIIVYNRVRANPMSRRTLDSVGLEELIRVTPLHCNNKKEIDTFLQITSKIVNNQYK